MNSLRAAAFCENDAEIPRNEGKRMRYAYGRPRRTFVGAEPAFPRENRRVKKSHTFPRVIPKSLSSEEGSENSCLRFVRQGFSIKLDDRSESINVCASHVIFLLVSRRSGIDRAVLNGIPSTSPPCVTICRRRKNRRSK